MDWRLKFQLSPELRQYLQNVQKHPGLSQVCMPSARLYSSGLQAQLAQLQEGQTTVAAMLDQEQVAWGDLRSLQQQAAGRCAQRLAAVAVAKQAAVALRVLKLLCACRPGLHSS